jgi:lipopolysaccharide biosynthesis regulator YciM
MNWYWIVLFILIGLLLILFLIILIMKRFRKEKTSPYEEALISLIDGNEDHAMKKFQEAVFADSDNIEAYIRLAELLRKHNEPLKALQIHKYLLARRRLPRKVLNKILHQTAKDYITLEAYQKATDTLKRLIKTEPHNETYYKLLLHTYEKSSLWNEAIDLYKRMLKRFKYSIDEFANYNVYSAFEASKKGEIDWSEKVLLRVLKNQPENIPALFYLGDIYYKKGKNDEAISLYNKIIDIDSKKGFITFPHLMKAYYDKGDYGKIEETYKKVLEKIPEDENTTVSLAEFYLKMGRLDEARELLTSGIQTHRDSLYLNLMLLLTELEHEKNKSVSLIRNIIDIFARKEIFRCSNCNSLSNEYLIRCPECGEWETYTYERK